MSYEATKIGGGVEARLALVNGLLRVARGSMGDYLLVQPIGPFNRGINVRFCPTVPLMTRI